jgi:hypothetical protein
MATATKGRRRTKKPPIKLAVPPTAEEMLGQLNEIAPEAEADTSASRPILDLVGASLEAFEKWICVNEVYYSAREDKKLKGDTLKEEVFDIWTKWIWGMKTIPTNPLIRSKKNGLTDSQAIFQVQSRFVVDIPDDKNSPRETIVKQLVQIGLTKKKAENLVKNELIFTPALNIPLSDLVHGSTVDREWVPPTETSKSAAQKLMKYILAKDCEHLEPLTDDERKLIFRKKGGIRVKDGFLQRIFSYVTSLNQLRALLKIIKPVHYASHGKFAINDSAREKKERLAEVVDFATTPNT